MRVIVVSAGRAGGTVAECGCCGIRYPVKKKVLWFGDAESLYGTICPDCITRGPMGAAMLLAARLRETETGIAGGRPAAARKDLEAWRGRIARKAAALEKTESFPLEARQAAATELRERR